VVHDRFIPSVITPNNDNKNQYFILRGFTNPVELFIFDRSGRLVYSQKSYENNWDGYSNSHHELPDDTYFYVIKTADGQVIKGSVLIKR
jgi:gliding motility-associated-like protein